MTKMDDNINGQEQNEMKEKVTDATFLEKMLERIDSDYYDYGITPQYGNYRYDVIDKD